MSADPVLATTAAHRAGLILSDRWPLVAAHLIALGHHGPDVLAMACLGEPLSGWQVDQREGSFLGVGYGAVGEDLVGAVVSAARGFWSLNWDSLAVGHS